MHRLLKYKSRRLFKIFSVRLFVLAIIFSFSINVFGNTIDQITANNVALTFFKNNSNSQTLKSTIILDMCYKVTRSKTNLKSTPDSIKIEANYFYVFNDNASHRYVIVSGIDNIIPILGFSDESVFSPNNIPPNLADWLEGYKRDIDFVLENNIQSDDKVKQQWNDLSLSSTPMVGPLIQTLWDQGVYYNAYCPYDYNYGVNTVTGCVATSLAQILDYWNYPIVGQGSNTYSDSIYGTLYADFGNTIYNWSDMPYQLLSPNYTVAQLIYQCGVSVNTKYNPTASSAVEISEGDNNAPCAQNALIKYFRYSPSLQGLNGSSYSSQAWILLLEGELNAKRPILYSGANSNTENGHAFICDGYDNNNYFHFNWGWSGNFDGYFAVTGLTPIPSNIPGYEDYNFNYYQGVIIGIEPLVNQTIDVTVFPNPSNGQFNIRFNKGFTGNAIISVHNSLGIVVMQNIINSPILVGVDYSVITNLNNGLYFLKVSNDNQSVTKSIFIVN